MSVRPRSLRFDLAIAGLCIVVGGAAAVLVYFSFLHPYVQVERNMGDYYNVSVVSPRWTSAYDGEPRSWLIDGHFERCYYDENYALEGGMLRCRDGQDEYVPMTLWGGTEEGAVASST